MRIGPQEFEPGNGGDNRVAGVEAPLPSRPVPRLRFIAWFVTQLVLVLAYDPILKLFSVIGLNRLKLLRG